MDDLSTSDPEATHAANLRTASSATQLDVARLAKVNQATVSRALDPRRRDSVNPRTVRRVQEAAAVLGYSPNPFARTLRTQRSNLVGLTVPDLASPVQAAFAAALSERLAAVGAKLVITEDRLGGRDDLSQDALVDGMILFLDGPLVQRPTPRPFLTVARAHQLAPDVLIDDRHGLNTAVAHLRRLGHSSIALVCEPSSTLRGSALREAFETAMQEGGRTGVVASYVPHRPASAAEACTSLFYREHAPTAIVLSSDQAALACFASLRALGLSVPADVSVVAMGDSPYGRYIDPPLTTVHTPTRLAGVRAADMIIEQVSSGEAQARQVIAPYLVHRSSTAHRTG